MFCSKCGTQNADGTRYCSNCGADLSANIPTQQPYDYPPVSACQPAQGYAIASLVLSIVSFFIAAIITGCLAIIFGGVAKSKGNKSPMSTAGIVCGIISVVLYVIALIAYNDNISNLLK